MKNNKQTPDFDFDQWAKMANQDPEQFERMRQQLINELMERAPVHLKQRMEGLQWQIDQIRKQANNPMTACLHISQQMWDKVYGERGLLKALQEPEMVLQSLSEECTANNVVPLNKYKPTDIS
ncbi:MAG: DUF3135 domain-containing protein [Nitrosomonas sp.]|nr:DUF3135 domain-containing protein [Nitrosomonas sp.]MDP1951270.1 DUF3135 domain-containing protein [Nitrosomonas sp.]